jgi:hypothetical protein
MYWIILSVLLSFTPVEPSNVSVDKSNVCNHDVSCGVGDCWRGFCEAGQCQAYWTCV